MPRREFKQRVAFRRLTVRQITRVLRDRYGTVLPDDDAGRDDLRLILGYLAHLPNGTTKVEHFIDLWAPWCALGERELELREAHLKPPPRLSADQLAERLGVTMELRTRLALTVIGAIDCDKQSRAARRKERRRIEARERMARLRRTRGAKLRAEYEAKSLSRTKPWEAEGISRRTWERRRNKRVASPFASKLKDRVAHTLASRRVEPMLAGEHEHERCKAVQEQRRHHKRRVA
jgi:hypothetical protein